ncbi:unnamed protein product [Parajaminaea phylloscopi]
MRLRSDFGLLLSLLACTGAAWAGPASTSYETKRSCSTFGVQGQPGRTTLRDSPAETLTVVMQGNPAPVTVTSTKTLPGSTQLSVRSTTTTKTVTAVAETDVATVTDTKVVIIVPSTAVTVATVTPTTTSTTTLTKTVTERTATVYNGGFAQPTLIEDISFRRSLEDGAGAAAKDVFRRGVEARAQAQAQAHPQPHPQPYPPPKPNQRTAVRCRNNVTKHVVSTRPDAPRSTVTKTATKTGAPVTKTVTVAATKTRTVFPAGVTSTVTAAVVTTTVTAATRTDTITPTADTVTETATLTAGTETVKPTATLAALCDPVRLQRRTNAILQYDADVLTSVSPDGVALLDEARCCNAAAQVSGCVAYIWLPPSTGNRICLAVVPTPQQRNTCRASSVSSTIDYTNNGVASLGLMQCGLEFNPYPSR